MAKRGAPKKQSRPHPAFRCHDGREIETLEHAIVLLLELELLIMSLSAKVTDALAAQDAKIVEVDQKVDAFIASHQTNSDADDQVVVDRLAAQGQALDRVGAKLTPPA